jgi:hypothetical protein
MTINQTIMSVCKAVRARVHPNFIKLALINEGYSEVRADTIIGWARNVNANNPQNQSAGSCL